MEEGDKAERGGTYFAGRRSGFKCRGHESCIQSLGFLCGSSRFPCSSIDSGLPASGLLNFLVFHAAAFPQEDQTGSL